MRLHVDDVARYYGRRKALSQITFTCEPGEIVGLLGPNGAGKSTLLNILATLLKPSKGTIRYGEFPDADGPELRGRIGMLGHDLFLYPELTARENLTFFAQLYGLPDVDRRVTSSLATAGLADRGDDLMSGFSRGMRQRIALERALLHDPTLILLDEPFTGLDQASTVALVERLRDRQHAGCVIVLATHDLEVADGVLTRAVYLKNGRMVGMDTESGNLANRYRKAIQ